MNKTLRRFLLTFLFPVCMWAAWPPKPLVFLVFVAWIPLLLLEKEISESTEKRKGWKIFGFSFLAFLLWNVMTTWWVGNTTSPSSGVAANIANTCFMIVPYMLFSFTKKKLGNYYGYLSFVTYWLTFEYVHCNWQLSFPWLNLGNVFAGFTGLVQWYEYTGIVGGSLWVLILNLLFLSLLMKSNLKTFAFRFSSFAVLLFFPVFFSLLSMFGDASKPQSSPNIVIVQPNIDPYNEKFDSKTYDEQLNTLIKLSEEKIDSNTTFVLWPETSLPGGVWIDEFKTDEQINFIRNFLRRHPQVSLVAGANLYQHYFSAATLTARKFNTGEEWWDAFNSAILIDTSSVVQYYHKTKLVPGAERMPYPQVFKFLEKYSMSLGGISGSLGTNNEAVVFTKKFRGQEIKVAPLICFESAFGEYTTDFIRKGAQIIFLVTNDGWWDNTAGHTQHMLYSRLRAIETRRWVAMCANTGTSCFISPDGDIYDKTDWWKGVSTKRDVSFLSEETFYVKHGDYISRCASAISVMMLLYLCFVLIRRKFFTK